MDRFAGHAARRAARASARAAADAEQPPESSAPVDAGEGAMDTETGAALEEYVPGAPRDSLIDPDEFKAVTDCRKPPGFAAAVGQARDVHIDHMRVLLEVHYDEAHRQRWQQQSAAGSARGPAVRKSQRVVFRSVVEYHHTRRNDSIELPQSVMDVLQVPEDERHWQTLEDLRRVILRVVEGESVVELPDAATAQALADAVREGAVDQEGTIAQEVVSAGSPFKVLIPRGARVDLPSTSTDARSKKARAGKLVSFFESLARPDSERRLTVFMWPLGSEHAPPILDGLGCALAGKGSLKTIARTLDSGPLGQEELVDGMLLILWRALFRAKSAEWTQRGVANLGPKRTLGLARWWLKGQAVGRRPLIDGMCARCSALLHGTLYQTSALSNKRMGPPIDRDDNVLVDDEGVPATSAQPPCLLRYSPQLFAHELPEMFAHDGLTNGLSLKPGKTAPWLRPTHGRFTEASKDCTWLYCVDCHQYLFNGDACKQKWREPRPGKPRAHIPFRDRASTPKLKPSFKAERTKQRTDEMLSEETPPERHEPAGEEDATEPPGTPPGGAKIEAGAEDTEADV